MIIVNHYADIARRGVGKRIALEQRQSFLSACDQEVVNPHDWDFLQYQFGGRAGVSVYQPQWTDADMAEIDSKLDDGSLSTGCFRKRTDGYIYIIQF